MPERREKERLVQQINRRLGAVERRLEALEKTASITVPVTTLAPEPYELLREIKVVVEPVDEDEYLATFFDAGLSASGCNPVEAVDGLKELLVSRYEYLGGLPPERLGPIPARQIAVLRHFLRKGE